MNHSCRPYDIGRDILVGAALGCKPRIGRPNAAAAPNSLLTLQRLCAALQALLLLLVLAVAGQALLLGSPARSCAPGWPTVAGTTTGGPTTAAGATADAAVAAAGAADGKAPRIALVTLASATSRTSEGAAGRGGHTGG